MKTRFENLHRLSNNFEKFCDNFITKIQKNLISIKKQIIENHEKNELKYLLHINTFSFLKILYIIYCLKFIMHKKLNYVKNIFNNCCSI